MGRGGAGREAYPGGAAVRAGVARKTRQRVQHRNNQERDGHELVGEEEPGEAVYPFAYERGVLQMSSITVPQHKHRNNFVQSDLAGLY